MKRTRLACALAGAARIRHVRVVLSLLGSPVAFTMARLIGVGLLVWAAFQPSINYSLAFRMAVVALAAWGVVRAFVGEDGALLLFFFVVGLIFFPFDPVGFARGVWVVLDAAAAVLLMLSIPVVDPAPFDGLSAASGARRLRATVLLVFGAAWALLGCVIIFDAWRGFSERALLALDGATTRARVIRITHDVIHAEDMNEMPVEIDVYRTDYVFRTRDGIAVPGVGELLANPASDLGAAEFDRLYPLGYELEAARTVEIDVRYQESNPANNRPVEDHQGALAVFVYTLAATAIGLLALVSGVRYGGARAVELAGAIDTRSRAKIEDPSSPSH